MTKINHIVSYSFKKPGVSSMSFRYTSFSQPRHMVVPCPELIGFEAFNFCGSNALFLLVRLCIRLRLRSYLCAYCAFHLDAHARAHIRTHAHTQRMIYTCGKGCSIMNITVSVAVTTGCMVATATANQSQKHHHVPYIYRFF